MSKNGLVTDGEGWFVVNARESRWRDEGALGRYCTFEGKRRFPQLGINVNVLEPGEAMGMVHRERAQEAFLVLAGQCLLIVEGEERPLKTWDFFHCPPETEHIIIATGEDAARYGASVDRETTNPAEAYAKAHAGLPRSKFVEYRQESLPDLG